LGFFLAIAFLLLLTGVLLVIVVLRIIRFAEGKLSLLIRAVLSLPRVKRLVASHPKAVAFLRFHFSPSEGLGLRLTLGFLASLVLALIFSEIAEEIHDIGLILVDTAALSLISRLRTPFMTELFMAITFLGGWYFVGLCSLLVMLVFLIARKPVLLICYVAVISGGGIFNLVLKAVYVRSRPPYEQFIAEAVGWSFPSGHAMTAVTFYGVLVYLLFVLVESPWTRAGGFALAIVLVFLIGFSRIYLGVHYPTDIIAGYIAGLLWLTVSITAVEPLRRRRGCGRHRSLPKSHPGG
jgi:membrane-associated phospholipid phosphatase